MKITLVFAMVLICMVCRTNAQQTNQDANPAGQGDGAVVNKERPGDAARLAHAIAADKISAEAFSLMDRGDLLEAEKLFLKAHATNFPDGFGQTETLLGLAELYQSERRYSEAIACFQAMYSLPTGSETRFAAVTYMEYALTLAEAERWSEAVAEYDEALVRIAIATPEYRKALEALETARNQAEPGVVHPSLRPEDAMPHEEMFQYLPHEWNVRFYPDHPRYDAMKAITHLFIGTHGHQFRYQPASLYLFHLRNAIGYDSKNAFAYYAYGKELAKAQQYQDAKNSFVKAQQFAGSNVALSDQIKPALAEAEIMIEVLKQQKTRDAKAIQQKAP